MNVFIKEERDALFSCSWKMKILNEDMVEIDISFTSSNMNHNFFFLSHNLIYFKLIYVAPTMHHQIPPVCYGGTDLAEIKWFRRDFSSYSFDIHQHC